MNICPHSLRNITPILTVSLTALKYFVKLQQILIFSHLRILITNIITHLKVKVTISPSGAVTFISRLYGGATSDNEITYASGLFHLLEVGDHVMADKGFDIVYDLMSIGVKLNVPPKLKQANTQMPKSHVITTRKIASLRIHVERAIQRIQISRILSSEVPLSLSHSVEHIWGICCALSLFNPPLVVDSPVL